MTNHIEKRISTFLLPDKIIVEVMNRNGPGSWNSSGKSKILPIDVSNIELGETVLIFLAESSEKSESHEQVKKNWKEVLKKAGYKTDKAFVESAKRVMVSAIGDKIIFEPYKVNVKQKIFYRLPDLIFEISPLPQAIEIGKELRKNWEKCFFIQIK